jgi:hypothetical protein
MNNEQANKAWPPSADDEAAIIEQAEADIMANRDGVWESPVAKLLLTLSELRHPKLRICRAVDQACEDRGYRTPNKMDVPLQRLLSGTLLAFRPKDS